VKVPPVGTVTVDVIMGTIVTVAPEANAKRCQQSSPLDRRVHLQTLVVEVGVTVTVGPAAVFTFPFVPYITLIFDVCRPVNADFR
jgi:hypothetical protein